MATINCSKQTIRYKISNGNFGYQRKTGHGVKVGFAQCGKQTPGTLSNNLFGKQQKITKKLSSKYGNLMSDGLRSLKAQITLGFKARSMYSNKVLMSVFGVGAPEALVIGVVALIVFGPKGLAEAARTLGKTLRAFQPTIKELQEVSSEFRNTLEEEIGLEEIKRDIRGVTTPTPKSTSTTPTVRSIEEIAKDYEPIPITRDVPQDLFVTDEMKAASAAAAWGPGESTTEKALESSMETAPLIQDANAPPITVNEFVAIAEALKAKKKVAKSDVIV
mmetsp:Transcript_18520/g.25658  ORF Transcript_18520/g.25658 Transcript_18520/m.25658 type:complete len:276 (+) Transcript_18520:99-926(+)|eukprot:CAMPEP_0196583500 /NCGR_PEP_ID=MMETSP1081-20130531/43863_1 /TAXON_ID=36882 /ORGANISM="Pyramimonas amylifera, Strain CCMP720" /LENGTH=275 /DNA_ID=CAMNT_0041904415 /DNA_START=81 /DNA_END=908 /DNA_ORIENTATION=-